ncbi:hypothetical protein C8R47DRAFT_803655 [Mycena vitilis]|nr:hypothetical protein C8R47DRAFT_803655 [Mycena vitilis]
MRLLCAATKILGRIRVRESPSSSCKLPVREWHRMAGLEGEQKQRLERNEFPAPQPLLAESVAHFKRLRALPGRRIFAAQARQSPTYSVSNYRGFKSTAVSVKAEGAEPIRRPRGRPRKDASPSAPTVPQIDALHGEERNMPPAARKAAPGARPHPTMSLWNDTPETDTPEGSCAPDESDSDTERPNRSEGPDWVERLADEFRYCPPGLELHLFLYRFRHQALRDTERQREEAREKLREVLEEDAREQLLEDLEELEGYEHYLRVEIADSGFWGAQDRAKLIRLGIIREDSGTGAGEPDNGSSDARWKGRRPHELSDAAKQLLEGL